MSVATFNERHSAKSGVSSKLIVMASSIWRNFNRKLVSDEGDENLSLLLVMCCRPQYLIQGRFDPLPILDRSPDLVEKDELFLVSVHPNSQQKLVQISFMTLRFAAVSPWIYLWVVAIDVWPASS